MRDDEMLAAFQRHHRARNLSRETTKRELIILRAVSRDVGKGLLELNRSDIEEWLLAKPRSGRTRSSYVSYLAAFYQWAIREGLTEVDPTRAIIRPRSPRLLPRPIADADLQIALQYAEPRMRAWLCLGAFEGLRAKEIAGLRGEDLYLSLDPPMLRVSSPKGHRERMVPVHPLTALALHGTNLPRRGWVFPGQCKHQAIRPGTVTKNISHYLRGLGIQATGHQLRHWFGSSTYRASLDLRLVQELLGHSSISTTAGYTAFSADKAAEIVRGLSLELSVRRDSSVDGNGRAAHADPNGGSTSWRSS